MDTQLWEPIEFCHVDILYGGAVLVAELGRVGVGLGGDERGCFGTFRDFCRWTWDSGIWMKMRIARERYV